MLRPTAHLSLDKTDSRSGAKEALEKGLFSGNIGKRHTSAAKAGADSVAFVPGINPWPTARTSFSAACKAHKSSGCFAARLKPCPFKTTMIRLISKARTLHFSPKFQMQLPWGAPLCHLTGPLPIKQLPAQATGPGRGSARKAFGRQLRTCAGANAVEHFGRLTGHRSRGSSFAQCPFHSPIKF
jgi:hypothetical protein